MNVKISGLVLVLLLAGVSMGQQKKQAEIDLQAAIRTENIKGLKAAIKEYETIVSKYGKTDRATAAMALIRLGNALGAKPATFAGLAGLGDLVLTCTGSLSRNRAVGVSIGAGATLDEAQAGKETVAEGVTTTRSAHALAAREGVEMPIVATVHRILFDGYPARLAVNELMTRELRAEQDA